MREAEETDAELILRAALASPHGVSVRTNRLAYCAKILSTVKSRYANTFAALRVDYTPDGKEVRIKKLEQPKEPADDGQGN